MTEIASALEYIHLQGVVFRDLKPTNIGFSAETNTVQIFDFGLSRELPSLDTSTPFSMSGKVGTLRYMAPEVAAHQPYNISSDVYSWAIVSYEILSLVKPFFGWTRDLHADLVCNRGIRPETTNTIHPISTEMVVLLEQSWSSVPSNRGSMSQIGVQLQCLLSSQVSYLNDHQQRQTDYQEQQQHQQQHQQHQRQFLDQQQQQQEQPVNTNTIDGGGFYIDNMPSCMLTYPPTALIVSKLTRRMSFETIETINTSSLSLDSINYF
ncbi:kinase-like protein [Fragilariopsis cylindrus CCMP1102]|uniref:Kinase-like protein n=1 Tax=Fragilariopsis cylindrus CCMP1102 TaxID=635003 RepID=A0A1E7FX47_9STRA|nr:kinase-like protein [Fragilariopsis cylindrus CCMP1102]|eukprot:OEU22383.1 kinase-like protein [Fragilariopsis cylindrus CCMP1102]